MNDTKQYLVVYENWVGDTDVQLFEVTNVKDCIIQFAIYAGGDCELFRKALIGCESDSECIEMYKKFGSCAIYEIYAVSNVVWSKNEKEK